MKNSKLTILISSLILMAATVILYLLAFGSIFSEPIKWVSLLFLLIAECIATLKALLVKQNIISQTTASTSVMHFVALLIISIVFVIFFSSSIKAFILLNILMLCALTAVDLFILFFAKNASASDKKMAQSQGVMNACYVKAQELIVIYSQSDYKKDLLQIAELIKYSDNSELTDDEAVIMSKLVELETQLKEGNETIPSLITEIKNAIELRTIKIKSIKRGGY